MNRAYISRVKIKNYRNFLDVDIFTYEKQLVLGENAVGKSNYIRALRLILDQSFSDLDRTLSIDDFNDTLANPMENGEIIEISIYISNYESNGALMSVLGDAKVNEDGFSAAKITYIFEPRDKTDLAKGYGFSIYKGTNKSNRGTDWRRYFNIRVINALRDANEDFSSFKKSPVFNIIKKYGIGERNVQFNQILEEIRTSSAKIFDVDEMADARNYIKEAVNPVLKRYNNSEIDLDLLGNKVPRIIGQLRILENGDFLSNSSLGMANIIYILLTLAASSTPPIPTFISAEKYAKLKEPQHSIIDKYYMKSPSNNYILNSGIELKDADNALISSVAICMDDSIGVNTIIAIEEPEAHLHPAFIRMIYKDIFEGDNSVIFTSHSAEIASVCPLRYYVDIKKDRKRSNISNAIAGSLISNCIPESEISRLERYIDTNRADIFFGRKIILVEGICEKMIVPKFASILNVDLDSKGIIICNVSSTNFSPYCKLLNYFDIPYVIMTDGDSGIDYTGKRRMTDFVKEIYDPKDVSKIIDWDKFFPTIGVFIGIKTLELDILESFHATNSKVILESVLKITTGGETHKNNFKDNYAKLDYDACFRAIESAYIGKANFIQEITLTEFAADAIPKYIVGAISFIKG